jgi:hypothetical protein
MSVLPMMGINGKSGIPNPARLNGDDLDYTPFIIRRYTNMGVKDIQLHSGTGHGIRSGRIMNYLQFGYLYAVTPHQPGYANPTFGGTHRRGGSPLTNQAVMMNTAGVQPNNPGNPGMMAATQFINNGLGG